MKNLFRVVSTEDITVVDYRHAKRIFKTFNDKNIGDYHVCIFKAIFYYLQVYLRTLEINALKYMSLIQLIFICIGISMESMFKKDRNKIRIMDWC